MSARWVSLPVESASRMPLVDGQAYRVRLQDGELIEATWEQHHGCGSFYSADDEPVDAAAVEIRSW